MGHAVWMPGLSAVMATAALQAAAVNRVVRSTEPQPTGAGSHPPAGRDALRLRRHFLQKTRSIDTLQKRYKQTDFP
jgi:hypothetical protein